MPLNLNEYVSQMVKQIAHVLTSNAHPHLFFYLVEALVVSQQTGYRKLKQLGN